MPGLDDAHSIEDFMQSSCRMRPALAMHYPNLRRTRSGTVLLDVLDFVGTNNTVYKFWLSYLQLVVVISGADDKVKGGVTLMHCRLNKSHLRDIYINIFAISKV